MNNPINDVMFINTISMNFLKENSLDPSFLIHASITGAKYKDSKYDSTKFRFLKGLFNVRFIESIDGSNAEVEYSSNTLALPDHSSEYIFNSYVNHINSVEYATEENDGESFSFTKFGAKLSYDCRILLSFKDSKNGANTNPKLVTKVMIGKDDE